VIQTSSPDPIVQQQVYRQELPTMLNQNKLTERESMKSDLYYKIQNTTDANEKQQLQTTYKFADLSDKIRQKANIGYNNKDQDVLTTFVSNLPNGNELMNNYLQK
jgi:hypothetical protein